MQTPSLRLDSVDALRGLTVAAMLLVNNAGDWGHVFDWLEHAAWHGCTPPDYIFPFFLVIVGVSIALALAPRLERGDARGPLAQGVLLRGARIVLLGLALHLIAMWLIPGREFRPMGVLQRIGICFALAGLAFVYLRAAWQWALIAGLLVGYSLLLFLGGGFGPHLNIADRVDNAVLGAYAYSFDVRTGLGQEPEGIVSTLGALASTLLGVRAGVWLRARNMRALLLAGGALLLAGALANLVMPWNKQLWTPSFVLWTSGACVVLLVAAHRLVDLRGWRPIGRSMGINAIVVYAGAWVATCVLEATGAMAAVYGAVFTPLVPWIGPAGASLAFAVAFTACGWGLMAWFARRGWRFSI